MKFIIEDEMFCDIPHVRVVGVYEGVVKNGENYPLGSGDFLHSDIDEAIDFFENIVKDLKEIK